MNYVCQNDARLTEIESQKADVIVKVRRGNTASASVLNVLPVLAPYTHSDPILLHGTVVISQLPTKTWLPKSSVQLYNYCCFLRFSALQDHLKNQVRVMYHVLHSEAASMNVNRMILVLEKKNAAQMFVATYA